MSVPDQPVAVIDAFVTDAAFSGNPAGVLVLDEFPDETWMQGVANELHQAETAFVVPGNKRFALRWFTPTAEVALCGHATLAASHWLWKTGHAESHSPIKFDTLSGELVARRHENRIVLDFPAVPAARTDPPAALGQALGATSVVWTGITDHPDVGERNILAVLADEDAVRGLVPDLRAVEQLPAGGLIVTALGAGGTDVVSRYFAPAFGIPEDPVTGSAHCTIGPYWQAELGSELRARQLSPRGGLLRVVTDDRRVQLQGEARTAFTGNLHRMP
ncbi:PhzF family phenazine biosynthesis protein [Actinoplanes sp. NPDC051633]|uniref:PhzF family phenazine biosynthesis protein n=1 Tax=Actinoplanes sp. NPDC051633 TaxID=3155670 RepID=UPI00343A0E21